MMCWCNPNIRTPHCGKVTCVPSDTTANFPEPTPCAAFHCYHAYNGAWNGVYPPSRVCCRCGMHESQEHGPFLPWGYR